MTAFDLAEMVFDADVSRILAMTYSGPIGVREVSEVLQIPQVRSYRRIKDLERIGLLKATGSNKRNRTYSSNMEHMSLIISEDRLVLTAEFRDGGISNFDLNMKRENPDLVISKSEHH